MLIIPKFGMPCLGFIIPRLALLISLFGATTTLAEDTLEQNIYEGKVIIQDFMGSLQSVLQSSIESGGPIYALEACNITAPQLAASHSQASGWQVARTSLKVRNQENEPDAWEKAVLEEFEIRKTGGEDPTQISKAEIVEENGLQVFRMMKAIPTGEVCTNCHGGEISPALSEKLDELYPMDQAIGFNVGDLRGAFTLKKAL